MTECPQCRDFGKYEKHEDHVPGRTRSAITESPSTRHYPILEDEAEPNLDLDTEEEICPECHMVRWKPTGKDHCGCL